jgi:hypothetical protein
LYEYDIDNGSGFSGTYKTLNATNISAETVGILKWRITTTVANTGNALTYIRITTVSTLLAQTNNLYPLDYATINLSTIVPNSRVQIYDTTNSVELYNQIVTGTTLSYSAPYSADFVARIRVMYQDATTAKEIVEIFEIVTIN